MPGTPLNDQLRAAREAAGLSVSEVARRAKTSRAAIYAYEAGVTSPSLDTAHRVLAASGCELAVIRSTAPGQVGDPRGAGCRGTPAPGSEEVFFRRSPVSPLGR